MPRTKTFDEDQVLQAAMMLFWRNGYEATSIGALEREMKLVRTSIYNAYGDKRNLFRQALARYFEIELSQFSDAIEQAETARDALRGVFKEVIRLHFSPSHPGGCLMVLSLLESEQHDAETRRSLQSVVSHLKEAITTRLERGVEEGELPADCPCAIIGGQATAIVNGMIVIAKADISREELEALIDASVSMLLPE